MNTRNYSSTDYIPELLRLLDWPFTTLDKLNFNQITHHSGRVRALAWVVCGIDFGSDVLEKKYQVKEAVELVRIKFGA